MWKSESMKYKIWQKDLFDIESEMRPNLNNWTEMFVKKISENQSELSLYIGPSCCDQNESQFSPQGDNQLWRCLSEGTHGDTPPWMGMMVFGMIISYTHIVEPQ